MAIYCSTIPALRPSDWRARLWAMGIFRDIVHALVQRCFVITLCLMFNLIFILNKLHLEINFEILLKKWKENKQDEVF